MAHSKYTKNPWYTDSDMTDAMTYAMKDLLPNWCHFCGGDVVRYGAERRRCKCGRSDYRVNKLTKVPYEPQERSMEKHWIVMSREIGGENGIKEFKTEEECIDHAKRLLARYKDRVPEFLIYQAIKVVKSAAPPAEVIELK